MEVGIQPLMTSKRAIAVSSVLGLSVAGLMASAPAHAEPEESASSDVETQVEEFSGPESQQAEEYWTEERMASAEPADADVSEGDAATLQRTGEDDLQVGEPRTVWPSSSTPSELTTPANAPHIGKVFFTIDGNDHVCSANLVASQNESTVATAGHCLHDGPGGDFVNNFVFAPAYDNGPSEDYGTWAAETLVTPPEWSEQGDISFDGGFAVLETQSNETLEETLGTSSPIGFNHNRGEDYTAYGYPAVAPYDGEELVDCAGPATDDPEGETNSQGISCDMTQGSSGGPWFLGEGPNGVQNSVNSFGYTSLPNVMFGPYFGPEIEDAYDEAQVYQP